MKTRILVAADPARKLLQLSFTGAIGLDEIKYYEKSVEDALKSMSNGFYLVTDLTKLESMELACVPHIERTMDRIRVHGVARIVRIVPDPRKDIGFNIMSLFHYPHGLMILTCKDQAEAEEALK